METTEAKRPLLPVWNTVGDTYRLVWNNKGEYFKIAWYWLVLSIPILFLLNYYEQIPPVFHVPHQQANVRIKTLTLHYFLDMLQLLQNNFVELFCSVPIAVAWHRLILINEPVRKSYNLRFNGVVWDYFYIAAVILLIQSAATFCPVFIWWKQGRNFILFDEILTVVANIIGIYFCTRLFMILPARALERKNITFLRVLQRTGSNFWRLFWGSLFSTFLGFVIMTLFGFIRTYKANEDPVMHALFAVFDVIVCVSLLVPFYLAFFSLAFQHFFPEEE